MVVFKIYSHAVALAKGLAIFGVVAHHIANRRFGEVEREWIGLAGLLSDWAVPLFILLSGYLAGVSNQKKAFSLRIYAKKRFNRLIVPFLIVSLVYALVYEIIFKTGIFTDFSAGYTPWYERFLKSIVGIRSCGEQLYFLPLLFVISLLACGLFWVHRKTVTGAWVLVLGLMVWAILLEPSRVIFHWNLKWYLAGISTFGVGYLLANLERMRWRYFVLASILCIGALLSSNIFAFNFIYPGVIFTGLCLLDCKFAWLERIGAASGTIYLYHTPFLLQSLIIMVAVALPDWLHVTGAYVVAVSVVLLLTEVHVRMVRSRFKFLAY